MDIAYLDKEQMLHAISADNAFERFIFGAYDAPNHELVLVTAESRAVRAPMSIFKSAPGNPVPDPHRLGIADWGVTIVLGEYEAASDAILHEVDKEHWGKMTTGHTHLMAAVRRIWEIAPEYRESVIRGLKQKIDSGWFDVKGDTE